LYRQFLASTLLVRSYRLAFLK
jgi:hypothetical protein